MATIVTRAGKGSPLTNQELDSNFSNLNTDKAELSGAVFTGAITTNSTIDGRDVATDGTKLDGVEASADVTDATNVTAAGALMDSELTSIASVKALNQGVATGDSPTFAAVTSTGEITANGGIALGDSDKATFGAGDDLQIYHDGANSYVSDQGTGDLILRGSTGIKLQSGSGVVEFLSTNSGTGALTLASTNFTGGIDVTGTATMDGITTSLGIDVNGTDDLRVRFLNGGSFKGGAQVATTSGDMITGSAVNDLAIRSQSNMLFATGGATERMRIDSSGNVLVGNTDTTLYNNTVANTGGGNFIKDSQGTRLDVSRDNTSLVLNRPTTEGDFATFYKGASSVGSIGVTGTNDLYIASTTASHTGLRLGEGYYIPTNNAGATADNAVDIGLASIRYKDLYLSGGVYLGGTGAANKLDDYEEGTWTPVTGPTSTTATYAFRSGYYTKVGNLVTCTFGLKHNGGVWTSGEATISGLPFTVDTTGSYQEPQFIVTSVGLLPTGKGGSAAGGAFNTGEVSFYCSGTQGRGRSYVSNSDTVMGGNAVFATNSFIKATIIYHSS